MNENRVREIRKKRGMSMVMLSVKAGVSYSNLCRYEKQQQKPSLGTAEKLAKSLETTVEELFGEGTVLKEIG
jgi:DNA-binding XRE family transcriptional regulator